ncbi:MAG: dNTP triphosphohydrolase [Paramuribaculum sp.]|nr:dNTP triphosphohydrolase [Paramuribaculum sp.]
MRWEKLISDKRFGLEDYHDPLRGLRARSDFQRDFDRLVFSSPFRRLQNKTQVFPLPGSIFVHNRLTHSIEVASVGRSLATEASIALRPKYADTEAAPAIESLGEIVGAACLAHDLGNPPFGHSGEKAISTFFSEGPGAQFRGLLSPGQWADLTCFDGNANAFRLLTHQFHGRRAGGFAMTYSTLASIVKYPYDSTLAGNKNKFGFFTTERDSFVKVAEDLGIKRLDTPEGSTGYVRHPLVYLVEAADDICYEVMDIEDAHKLGIIPTERVIEHMLAFFDPAERDHKLERMNRVADPNEKIGYLRSAVIGELVAASSATFVANEEAILDGTFSGTLLKNIPDRLMNAYRACCELSCDKIYQAPDVVDIELAGNRIISFLLESLVDAVKNPHLNYSRLLLSKVPDQYDVHAQELFTRLQAVVDHVSAMTDVYALDLYRRLNGFSLKINS